MKGLCKGRQEEVWLGLAGVLRLGISSALADFQPRRITRGAQTDALRLKRRRRNPPSLARPARPSHTSFWLCVGRMEGGSVSRIGFLYLILRTYKWYQGF